MKSGAFDRGCRGAILLAAMAALAIGGAGCGKKQQSSEDAQYPLAPQADVMEDTGETFVVLGYNDLGMHCMNQDFSEFMILPPFNTLHAQIVDRSEEPPRIVESGVEVTYCVPGNTRSCTKTNFWDNVQELLGVSLSNDIGLTGHGLWGTMTSTGNGDWVVTGIPLTPMTDAMQFNPFQLAEITVDGGERGARMTRAVVPVSWELRCDLCHGMEAPRSVLQAHDLLHGTALYDPSTGGPAGGTSVLCGGCHAQVELGLPGQPGRRSLSSAIHTAHAPRMGDVVSMVPKGIACYTCHPGVSTPCLRDVHARMQMSCYDCHANRTKDPQAAMLAVGDPARQPWASEPRCDDCHHRRGYEYEPPGVLYRNAKGHGNMYCEACHNSTHAIVPASDDPDNVQSILLQKHPGTVRKCSVCHSVQPTGTFNHRLPPSSI